MHQAVCAQHSTSCIHRKLELAPGAHKHDARQGGSTTEPCSFGTWFRSAEGGTVSVRGGGDKALLGVERPSLARLYEARNGVLAGLVNDAMLAAAVGRTSSSGTRYWPSATRISSLCVLVGV